MIREVFAREHAVIGKQFSSNRLCNVTLIKCPRALSTNLLQCAGKINLTHDIAGAKRATVRFAEVPFHLREPLEVPEDFVIYVEVDETADILVGGDRQTVAGISNCVLKKKFPRNLPG